MGADGPGDRRRSDPIDTTTLTLSLLDRYLFIALLRGGSPVLLGLLGLFGFIELAEQLEDVGKGTFSSLDALRIVAFSLPRIGIDLLPVTCLLGTVVGLSALANQSEITAMRACGLATRRLVRPLFGLLGAVILSVAALQQYVIPDFERRSADLRTHALADTAIRDDAHWTRSGSNLVRVGDVRYGTVPLDIEIYEFDAQGDIVRLIQADSADVIGTDEWLLRAVTTTQFGGEAAIRGHVQRLPWRNRISAEQLSAFVQADYALAPVDLAQYIGHLRDNGLDTHHYRLLLWHQLSLPLGLVAMALLGVPFVVGSTRAIPLGVRLTLGGAVGIAFYLLERTVTQVTLLYQLPAVPASLAPDLIALAVAVAVLFSKR